MVSLAPIVLFVYNRPEHTRRVLQALKLNSLSPHSQLYIYADGPKPAASDEEKERIMAVRNLIEGEDWCSEVVIRHSAQNKGLAKSILEGVSEVIDEHGRAIVLEDDILVSPSFLDYMNRALSLYANDSNVAGISGYKYPSKHVSDQTYFLPIGCSWGWATWGREWRQLQRDGEVLLNEIDERNLREKMNFGGYPFYQMLESQVRGDIDSWAIRFYASFFLREKVFLFPQFSLVRNLGFDKSGTHCGRDDFFSLIDLGDGAFLDLDSSGFHRVQSELKPEIVSLFEAEFCSKYQKPQAITQASSPKATLLFTVKRLVSGALSRLGAKSEKSI